MCTLGADIVAIVIRWPLTSAVSVALPFLWVRMYELTRTTLLPFLYCRPPLASIVPAIVGTVTVPPTIGIVSAPLPT